MCSQRVGHLPAAQAILVVQIAKSQHRLFGGTENFLVTREFREIASDAQREELLDCLFAVSAADDAISGDEEAQIWQIASELGFAHADYIKARLAYSDKRTVFRRDAAQRNRLTRSDWIRRHRSMVASSRHAEARRRLALRGNRAARAKSTGGSAKEPASPMADITPPAAKTRVSACANCARVAASS